MDPWEVAQAQVATKYDPQQNAIQRSLDQAKLNTGTNEQAIQGYGNTGRGVIGDTYNKLYQWLDYGKAQQQQDLGAAQTATNAGYDQAIQNIQGYQQNSRNYLNQMASALGQEGAGLRANTDLENLVNTQLGTANASRANYGGSLNDWVARMGAISDMGISSAHQGEAQNKADFESRLLEMLGSNKLAGTTQETDLTNKLTDIMGLRQSDLIGMYNELAQAEWERQFQQAQLDAQAQQANADLAYKYAALDASNANSAADRAASGKDDSLGWAQLQAAKDQNASENARAERELGLKYQPDPVDRQHIADLMWQQNSPFVNPATKQNDMQAYVNYVTSGTMPSWPTAAKSGGGGGINLNLGHIGSNIKNLYSSPVKAGLTTYMNANPVGLSANIIRSLW